MRNPGRCRRRPAIRAMSAVALLAALLTLNGCTGGRFAVASAEDPAKVLAGNFTTGVYAFSDEHTADIVLLEGSEENPSQAVHIQMHWQPRAGKTPLKRGGTNCSIRYLVFTGDEAGVYTGGGFLFPRSTPGGSSFRGELRDSTLRLVDRSEGFADRLGLAEATGDFSVRHDELTTERLLRRLRLRLRRSLGYPVFVQASDEPLRLTDRLPAPASW